MDDPDADGDGSGGSWPDLPGPGDPPTPGVIPPGTVYGCISPEIGNKAAYTVGSVPDGYTGSGAIFSDITTPYGDGIRIGASTVATASDIYKDMPTGSVSFVSVKFKVNTAPSDDCGALRLRQGPLPTDHICSLIFSRETAFDSLKRPVINLRSTPAAAFSSAAVGTTALTLGQWYRFNLTIASTVASFEMRTADTDVLFASGTVSGSWAPIAATTFSLWNDANVNTGSTDVADLRFCGFSPFAIPGTEMLTGIGMTATIGDLNTPSGSRKLSGQAMTTATGSVSVFNANKTAALVGQNMTLYRGALTALPYPDLLSDTREFIFAPVWESVFLTVLNNGTFTISETDLSTPAYTGNWLAPTTMDVASIASQYRGTAMTNYGAGTLDYTDLAPTALFSVSTTATSAVQKIHHFSITVVPTTTNPRYGEIGYQGVLRFRLALKLP